MYRVDQLKQVQDQLEIEVEQEFLGGWSAVEQFEVMWTNCYLRALTALWWSCFVVEEVAGVVRLLQERAWCFVSAC